MKKFTALVLLLGMVFGFGVQQVQAQTQIQLGPRLGFDIAGNVEEFFLGADSRFHVANFPVILNGSVDYYFADNLDIWQVGLNALYEIGTDNQTFTPYIGAGLGISRVSVDLGPALGGDSNTDLGLNVIGGAHFGQGNLTPFAQAQITFGDVEIFALVAGLLFTIGGR